VNLYSLLRDRSAEGRPIRVGVIGAGKFGSMFLAQARTTRGIHVMAVADLSAPRALQALRNTGWVEEQISAASFKQALSSGTTHVTEDAEAMIAADGVDVIVEATGNPIVGIHHALRCFSITRFAASIMSGPRDRAPQRGDEGAGGQVVGCLDRRGPGDPQATLRDGGMAASGRRRAQRSRLGTGALERLKPRPDGHAKPIRSLPALRW
jgi:GFO/IDH/MocA oxidoreductase family protein